MQRNIDMSKHDDDIKYEQPEGCKGCVWGKWEGTKQTCLIPRCWKGEDHEK